MSTPHDSYAAMLEQLRQEFVQDLPDRLEQMESMALQLEQNPEDARSFEELYRQVHSLKGVGGTLGIPHITTTCHQWEGLLQEDSAHQQSTFVDLALKYIDVLARIGQVVQEGSGDFQLCEEELDKLRRYHLQERYAVLIAESSRMMKSLFQITLQDLPLHLTVVDSGLEALERLVHNRYHLAVLGGELKELNGTAVAAALRTSTGRNRDIPLVLVTSSEPRIPDVTIEHVLKRDKALADNLKTLMPKLLR
ncbi:Hpt domain-containing protein [Desulfurispira natronophila]|uniref:Chemotaxis protein histidine kinase CheA n=1 Tax=Desulfurispira natronophila TaxID=682562 RepID=A0A7W8DHL6_9BACT|nr:response regulator [Desulfurispira natronophila]MBB5022502.1 chemotaxis protein histidine kinase CheA [Desulfurispira natronophila]